MRTFKEEEVSIRDDTNFETARRSIARFIEITYNERRLHHARDYRPPTEFEATLANPLVHLTPA